MSAEATPVTSVGRGTAVSKPPRHFRGLPFATLVALLGTALAVSVLSSYDEEARWLRLGMVLLAVGVAMWLPYAWAAAFAAIISLTTAYLRGGLSDTGLLRPETLLEVPGVAITAVLTVWMRSQIESLVIRNANDLDAPEGGTGERGVPTTALEGLRDERAFDLEECRSGQSQRAAEATYLLQPSGSDVSIVACKAALLLLQVELVKTQTLIRASRFRLLERFDLARAGGSSEQPGSGRPT